MRLNKQDYKKNTVVVLVLTKAKTMPKSEFHTPVNVKILTYVELGCLGWKGKPKGSLNFW